MSVNSMLKNTATASSSEQVNTNPLMSKGITSWHRTVQSAVLSPSSKDVTSVHRFAPSTSNRSAVNRESQETPKKRYTSLFFIFAVSPKTDHDKGQWPTHRFDGSHIVSSDRRRLDVSDELLLSHSRQKPHTFFRTLFSWRFLAIKITSETIYHSDRSDCQIETSIPVYNSDFLEVGLSPRMNSMIVGDGANNERRSQH